MRALRDWRWMVSALAVLGLLAFLARRFLLAGSGPGPSPGVEPILDPEEAAAHVGETATVCGTVDGAAYVPQVEGRPTFLNFGGRERNQAFTAVIWGEHRGRFDAAPERAYRGARVCVAGVIETHEGVPQIELRGSGQLRVAGSSHSPVSPGPSRTAVRAGAVR